MTRSRDRAEAPVILALILGLTVPAISLTRDPSDLPPTPKFQFCDFYDDARIYDVGDLLLCMNQLATNLIFQRYGMAEERVSERRMEPPDSDDPKAFLDGPYFSSNQLGNTVSSLLAGGLPGFFDFEGFDRTGSSLFGALSSIAQYDDLKCIPRILCEVASGSSPGSLAYRHTSALPDFRQNILFRLLKTAFDATTSQATTASPILTFGRAALIGYTHRGESHSCYREYPRCPRQPDQLILYLNNYNGGFFRFFNRPGDHYYRPPLQSPFYQYKGRADPGSETAGSSTGRPLASHVEPSTWANVGQHRLDKNRYDEDRGTDKGMLSTSRGESQYNKIVFPPDK